MVVEVLIPISGSFLDGLVTTLIADRYGPGGDINPTMRKIIEKFGVWRSYPIRQAISTSLVVGTYIGLSQLDDNTRNISPQELFSYVIWGAFYGIAILNTIGYIRKISQE